MTSILRRVLFSLGLFLAFLCPASAASGAGADTRRQIFRFPLTVGARAEAMGGAFTAVSDDETAFFWNPAGIALSPFLRVGWHMGTNETFDGGNDQPAGLVSTGETRSGNLDRASSTGFAMSWTFMGFHYQRFRALQAEPNSDGDSGIRGFGDTGGSDLIGLEISRVGVSVLQSLPMDNWIVAANFSYLSARSFEQTAFPVRSLGESDSLDSRLFEDPSAAVGASQGLFDLDLALMVEHGRWRFGLMARHLTEPAIASASASEFVLARRLRAGVSAMLGERVRVSSDLDLNPPVDWRREWSAGTEIGLVRGREPEIFLRGGLRTYLGPGAALPSVSLGGGFSIRGIRLDVAWLAGRRHGSPSRSGWWVHVSLAR